MIACRMTGQRQTESRRYDFDPTARVSLRDLVGPAFRQFRRPAVVRPRVHRDTRPRGGCGLGQHHCRETRVHRSVAVSRRPRVGVGADVRRRDDVCRVASRARGPACEQPATRRLRANSPDERGVPREQRDRDDRHQLCDHGLLHPAWRVAGARSHLDAARTRRHRRQCRGSGARSWPARAMSSAVPWSWTDARGRSSGSCPPEFMPPYFATTEVWAPIDMATLLADIRTRRTLTVLARRAPRASQQDLDAYLTAVLQAGAGAISATAWWPTGSHGRCVTNWSARRGLRWSRPPRPRCSCC